MLDAQELFAVQAFLVSLTEGITNTQRMEMDSPGSSASGNLSISRKARAKHFRPGTLQGLAHRGSGLFAKALNPPPGLTFPWASGQSHLSPVN